MRRTYKINRKTKRGGMNSDNNKTKNNNKNKRHNITLRPTITHPNNLQKLGPPGVREMRERLKFLRQSASLSPSSNSFFKNTKPGFRGAGITQSRSKFPPLPETPTNRPGIEVNNELIIPPKKSSEEYKRRAKLLVNRFRNARQRTLKNIVLGKERHTVPVNMYGYPIQSYFKPNNGFKPSQ